MDKHGDTAHTGSVKQKALIYYGIDEKTKIGL